MVSQHPNSTFIVEEIETNLIWAKHECLNSEFWCCLDEVKHDALYGKCGPGKINGNNPFFAEYGT